MGIAVSPAVAADRAHCIALWQAAGLTRPWNDPGADFDRALAGPASTVLIARDGDQILGSIMVGDDGHRGWVYYLSSHPDHRRTGTGRALMQAAEQWLHARGCPRIRLMVRADNAEALGFYAALGYAAQDVVTLGRTLDPEAGG